METRAETELRLELEMVESVRPVATSSRSAVVGIFGLISVLAATILVGLSGPSANRPEPAFAGAMGSAGNTNAPDPAPIALSMPASGELIDGSAVSIRGSATEAIGDLRAILSVAGREIAASDFYLDRTGAFSIDLPFVAPPFATSAELVIERIGRRDAPFVRRALRLRPPTGMAIHGVALEDGQLVVRGEAPRSIPLLEVGAVGPDGAKLAHDTVAPAPSDGWGGVLIPTSLFSAEIDLADVPGTLAPGTPITIRVSWHDPWTDGMKVVSFLLVVPNPNDTIP